MGFFDALQEKVGQGTAAAGRIANSAKIRSQINDVNKRRHQLAAQLGASLYEATKEDAALREGREDLYDAIAQCDVERADLQAQLDRIEAEAMAAQTVECPQCHSRVSINDRFCSGCGMPVEQILAAQAEAQAAEEAAKAAMTTCPMCGLPVSENDAFCMECGCNIAEAREQLAANAEAQAQAEAEAEAEAADEAEEAAAPEVLIPQEVEFDLVPEPEPEPEADEIVCPACGTVILPGNKFCGGCGRPIE